MPQMSQHFLLLYRYKRFIRVLYVLYVKKNQNVLNTVQYVTLPRIDGWIQLGMLLMTRIHILRSLTRFGVETCSFASCLLGLLDCAMTGLGVEFLLCNDFFICVIQK